MTLHDYYTTKRILYHIGKEHPALEQVALTWLRQAPRQHVLELGYQAGGFAVPLITALASSPTFRYCGVDSLAYPNAVPVEALYDYLHHEGLDAPVRFHQSSVGTFLCTSLVKPYDLVLMDHAKRDYPLDLWWLLRRGWVAPNGVVLLHDVLGKAKGPITWLCHFLATLYGYSWDIRTDVPEGLAVLQRPKGRRLDDSHELA